MWTARQRENARERRESAELGVVTIGGNPAAVETCGEVRDLPVYGPGGYAWTPKRGDKVLVIKSGTGDGELCVAGTELKPGEDDELTLTKGEAALVLREDGRIDLWGQLYVNGQPYIRPAEG